MSGRTLVFTMLVAGAIALWWAWRGRTSEVAIESIAVLPFANESNDSNTDYLSDGITESIINSLSELPHLKVMARTTVFRYKARESDAQKVRKELTRTKPSRSGVLPAAKSDCSRP